jgi:Secretion system C-terminal sorting domain
MKHMLLALFTSFSLVAVAQITVTNVTFPSAGDSILSAVDQFPNLAASSVVTAPGGNQNWDFSALTAENEFKTIYKSASSGDNFTAYPGADLLLGGDLNETYFNKTATKIEALGYAGLDPANLGLQVLTKFSPPVALRRAPMNFFDINQVTTDLSLPFSIDQLPDSLLGGIPGVGLLDSIRIRIHFERLDVVDAWGNLKVSGVTYPVLREKRTEYTTTNADVHSLFGWIAIPLGQAGGGFADFLGTDTSIVYHYFSATDKEAVAVVRVNNTSDEVERVTYKINTLTDIEDESAPGTASIRAFPNPAVESVRFDCANLPQGEYTVKIFNIVGKVIWRENHQINGNKSIRVDLENFKKGAYLYSLSDKKGNIISTKRLVILKP